MGECSELYISKTAEKKIKKVLHRSMLVQCVTNF